MTALRPGLPGLLACAAMAAAPGVLARYDFAAPRERWELPKSLAEISGLAVSGGGRLFAHGDEQAVVFELDPASGRTLRRFGFGRPAVRGDFEGIAVVRDRIFLVTSDGVLYAGAAGSDGAAVPFVAYSTGLGRYCEVEGLAYEPGDNSLLLACKQARRAPLRGHLAVYRWSLDQRALGTAPRFFVPLSRVLRRIGGTELHPSDIARDPATGHFLVVAAQEHALVELTAGGEVVESIRLPRSLHRQAEGLAFTADGALLVGDEGRGKRATLTVYRPKD